MKLLKWLGQESTRWIIIRRCRKANNMATCERNGTSRQDGTRFPRWTAERERRNEGRRSEGKGEGEPSPSQRETPHSQGHLETG